MESPEADPAVQELMNLRKRFEIRTARSGKVMEELLEIKVQIGERSWDIH